MTLKACTPSPPFKTKLWRQKWHLRARLKLLFPTMYRKWHLAIFVSSKNQSLKSTMLDRQVYPGEALRLFFDKKLTSFMRNSLTGICQRATGAATTITTGCLMSKKSIAKEQKTPSFWREQKIKLGYGERDNEDSFLEKRGQHFFTRSIAMKLVVVVFFWFPDVWTLSLHGTSYLKSEWLLCYSYCLECQKGWRFFLASFERLDKSWRVHSTVSSGYCKGRNFRRRKISYFSVQNLSHGT